MVLADAGHGVYAVIDDQGGQTWQAAEGSPYSPLKTC